MLPAFQIKNTRSHQSLLKTVKALGGTDLAFAHFRPPTAQMAACLRRPRFQAEDACCSTGKQSGAPRSGNWMAPNETVGGTEWRASVSGKIWVAPTAPTTQENHRQRGWHRMGVCGERSGTWVGPIGGRRSSPNAQKFWDNSLATALEYPQNGTIRPV